MMESPRSSAELGDRSTETTGRADEETVEERQISLLLISNQHSHVICSLTPWPARGQAPKESWDAKPDASVGTSSQCDGEAGVLAMDGSSLRSKERAVCTSLLPRERRSCLRRSLQTR